MGVDTVQVLQIMSIYMLSFGIICILCGIYVRYMFNKYKGGDND